MSAQLDRSLERYVAIKVINGAEVCDDSSRLQAFVHEARAQARRLNRAR